MKNKSFVLIYNFDKAYLFQVSVITFTNVDRAVRVEVDCGEYDTIIKLARQKIKDGYNVRTGHYDGPGEVVVNKWRRGIGNYSLPRESVENKHNNKNKRSFKYDSYKDYLNSKDWKEKREAVIKKARGRCQVCNSRENLNVHHRTYVRVGCEKHQDLIVLCRDCHEIFHKNGKIK